MITLNDELRNKLEKVIIEARDIAEAGAKSALEALAVHHHEPYGHMTPEMRKLRNHLRARARQLGDRQAKSGLLEINRLVQECAYEYWHRMLFARFLAENDLLIEPESGVAVSLEECEELAKEEGTDLWILASRYAQQMLPQIFRTGDPVLQVGFAREHRLKLEQLLDSLEVAVFKASDSLGWVYQFWQSKRKKQVNESGVKIGADELPAVTQLFTEPYMVNFLIHNTLGAWHAGKVLAANPELAQNAQSEEELRQAVALPGVSWDYLRFVRDDEGTWRPAAGNFEGWPKRAAELKILDPCCGSGHFLVAILLHLVPLRMTEENITAQEAINAVLRDNIHGLEIDERCTQIAAFAIALASWTLPGAGGYRQLPSLRIACSGIAPNTKKKVWIDLVGNNENLRKSMAKLYELFRDAPLLGSLIDSGFIEDFEELNTLLKRAMPDNKVKYDEQEMGVAACDIIDAVQILRGHYHLIITNVPYLARTKHSTLLKEFADSTCPDAKLDLATLFLNRCLKLTKQGGATALVTPQGWLFLTACSNFRERLLHSYQWRTVARLGAGAFETITGEIVNTILLIIENLSPNLNKPVTMFDVSQGNEPKEKDVGLKLNKEIMIAQSSFIANPDSTVTFKDFPKSARSLGEYADVYHGITTTDYARFGRYFWEVNDFSKWKFQQTTVDSTINYGGRSNVILWENGGQEIRSIQQQGAPVVITGLEAWGQRGVAINQMGKLYVSLYSGDAFDTNISIVIPRNDKHLAAIWAFLKSTDFHDSMREFNPFLKVEYVYFSKVPFDLKRWSDKAEKIFPYGLPEPQSNDPTQWLFLGHPIYSINPLQVAVAKLCGYHWPAENDIELQHSFESKKIIEKGYQLNEAIDKDGIVCLPSVRGENLAAERLRSLLASTYGEDWCPAKEHELLVLTNSKAKNFDEWLRDHFFEQHCKIFKNRPFIWHIWDGRRRDGFHALVNYHKLAEGDGKGRKLLESLTYSYLGEWIARQKDGVKRGEGGAEDRLAAAVELQNRLIAILEGEPPFDIFVRWKPIEKQPVGWEPDINDGVRINIRPFMASDLPGGRKGAGVLRWKPNIKWNKDRGKEPVRPMEQFPWFWKDGKFVGDRVNDIHLTNEEKRRAREEAVGKSGSGD